MSTLTVDWPKVCEGWIVLTTVTELVGGSQHRRWIRPSPERAERHRTPCAGRAREPTSRGGLEGTSITVVFNLLNRQHAESPVTQHLRAVFSLAPAFWMCPSIWLVMAMSADVIAPSPRLKGGVAHGEIAPVVSFLCILGQCLPACGGPAGSS